MSGVIPAQTDSATATAFHKHFVTIKHSAQGRRIPQLLQFFIHFNQSVKKPPWSSPNNSEDPCRRGKKTIKKINVPTEELPNNEEDN